MTVATDFRKAKSAALVEPWRRMRPWTAGQPAAFAMAGGVLVRPLALADLLGRDAGQAGGGEIRRIGAAAELAIGDDFEAELFLQPHEIADGRIFGCAQLLERHVPGFGGLPRVEQSPRAEEAADMLGAKRRRWKLWHIGCPGYRRSAPSRVHAGAAPRHHNISPITWATPRQRVAR